LGDAFHKFIYRKTLTYLGVQGRGRFCVGVAQVVENVLKMLLSLLDILQRLFDGAFPSAVAVKVKDTSFWFLKR
jgi:hypothetical protein